MTTVDVRHRPESPSGGSPRTMTAELIATSYYTDDGTATVLGTEYFEPDSTGLVTMALRPNSELAQTGTYYRVRIARSSVVYYAVVPDAGPVQLVSILVDPDTLNPVDPPVATLFQLRSEKAQANGYASLDGTGKVPSAQLPAGSGGISSVNGDTGPDVVLDAADVGAQPVDSDLTAVAALTPANNDLLQRIAGAWTNRTPAQVKTSLALDSVDNTSDLGKPISTATQAALDQKRQPVNPLSRWNLKGASGDPAEFQGGVGLGSGNVWASLVYVPAGEPITSLWAAVRVGGTYSASAVPNQIGLWTEAGVPVGNTADDNTLWAAAGWRGGAVVGGAIAAQAAGRFVYIGWIIGGFDTVSFPFPASAADANAVWFAFGPGITRRGAFYIAGGQTALPGTFDPTTIGTATTSAPLVGFN